MRLLLIRHGRSAHAHDGTWLDLPRAREFEKRYDAASIRPDDQPPEHLVALGRNATTLMASDLPRAMASIERLAPGRDAMISPLLREVYFDIPAWGPRLPMEVWDMLHYAMWTGRMFSRLEHAEMKRAREAAAWVDERATDLTLAVTHGGFRRLLARQLATRGWKRRGPRSYANWSAWEMVRD